MKRPLATRPLANIQWQRDLADRLPGTNPDDSRSFVESCLQDPDVLPESTRGEEAGTERAGRVRS
jgi:hypothetical protein